MALGQEQCKIFSTWTARTDYNAQHREQEYQSAKSKATKNTLHVFFILCHATTHTFHKPAPPRIHHTSQPLSLSVNTKNTKSQTLPSNRGWSIMKAAVIKMLFISLVNKLSDDGHKHTRTHISSHSLHPSVFPPHLSSLHSLMRHKVKNSLYPSQK